MKINEAEKLLEIPKATIRYYEAEGLIDPARTEKGYRDYSDADIARLKQIIILRKMGISVDAIRRIQQGEETLPQAAEASRRALLDQIDELNGAISLCDTVIARETTLDTLDTEAVWTRIRAEETAGTRFASLVNDWIDYQSDMFGKAADPDAPAGRKLLRLVLLLALVVLGASALSAALGVSSFTDNLKEKGVAVVIAAAIFSVIFLIRRKNPKAGEKAELIVGFIALAILVLALGALVVLWLNSKLHFWF